jgi:amino acid transporter/isopenicillin N synthase-like dioxygenase
MPSALRRDLGTLESYAALLGILIGAGIFKVTSEAWSLTGPSVILAYLVLAPAILATSVAYSVFISTPLGREPGGEYAHISRTFGGYGLAFVGVWLKIISYIGALAFLARAFADYLLELVGRRQASPMPAAIAVLLLFYGIHVIGIRWFGRTQVWMCALLGLSLLVLIVPGLFAIRPSNYRPFITHGLAGFLASLPPLFFAYAGFEALAQTAGEVRDSTRRLPQVFLRGILATTVIFLLMSVVAFGVLPGEQLRAAAAPMTEVASRYLPIGAAAFVTIGALMAITTSLNGTMLVPSRVAIMLVEDGLAPRWLGRISPRTGTPIIGLTITTAIAILLLVTGQVGLALNIAVFALVILYFIHSLALLVLPWANRELYQSITAPIPLAVQRIAAVLSMISMGALIVLQLSSASTVALAIGWSAVGALMYWIARRAGSQPALLRATNQDFIRYEQVEKPQSYHLAEAPEEAFDDDFQIRTCDMNSPTFARDLGDALHEIGFAILEGTGVDPKLYEQAEDKIVEIFERCSLEEKMRFRAQRNGSVNQGYFPIKETSNMHPDLVEGWVFCRRAFDRIEEFWPAPGYGHFFGQIVHAHERLILPVMQSMLMYLGCDPHLYDRKLRGTNFGLRLNYYPPMSRAMDDSGAARLLGHEDVDMFTFLPAPRVEGLQILNRRNMKWIRVVAPPGTIILNTGDYMQRISNDIFPSTTHRVSKPRDPAMRQQPRVSLPMAIYVWEDEVLEVLPGLPNPKYPPVKAIEFHTSITSKFYGDGYAVK